MKKKIILCEITELGLKSEVDVMYNDCTVEKLFTYYTDELSFDVIDFLGLTREEALDLYRYRDLAYLRC